MPRTKLADLRQECLSSLETVNDWIRFGISQSYSHQLFYGHGSDNPSDEMIALVLRTLELPLDTDSFLLNSRLITSEKELLFERFVLRIDERLPVSYILKEAIFAGQSFFIDQRVLIPRSPMAEMIEEQFSPWIEPDKVTSLCDLCTGSGCIGLAATMHLPNLERTVLIDISPDALDVARTNIERFGLEPYCTAVESDLFNGLKPEESFDIIISNPPYVPSSSMTTLPQEYLHEPHFALDGGSDGLLLVDRILAQAANHLTPHGLLIVEVGESQEYLEKKYPNVPFTWLQFINGGTGVFLLTAQELIEHRQDIEQVS